MPWSAGPRRWESRFTLSTQGHPGRTESVSRLTRDYVTSSANGELFTSVSEAQLLTNNYRETYNTTRAHSSLGYLSPHEFLALDVGTQRTVLTRSAKYR